jgi:hypothetical protein
MATRRKAMSIRINRRRDDRPRFDRRVVRSASAVAQGSTRARRVLSVRRRLVLSAWSGGEYAEDNDCASLGFLRAGAAAANAGEASRTLMHEFHPPRAVQLEILDPRVFMAAPVPIPARPVRQPETKKNPADCVKYGCIDNGDG